MKRLLDVHDDGALRNSRLYAHIVPAVLLPRLTNIALIVWLGPLSCLTMTADVMRARREGICRGSSVVHTRRRNDHDECGPISTLSAARRTSLS
jgi:hypothetical protein